MLLIRFMITLRSSEGLLPPYSRTIRRLTVHEAIDGAIRALRLHRAQAVAGARLYDQWTVGRPLSRTTSEVIARGDATSTLDQYRAFAPRFEG